MKKEINELLSKEEGILELNSMFCLKKYTLKPEDDILGRDESHLRLCIKNRYQSEKEITARTFPEIAKEISEGMDEMMSDYKEDLIKRFNGGELSKYL